MKKVSKRTVTSLIAVMSMRVLFLLIFTFPIVLRLLYYNVGKTMELVSSGESGYDRETDFVDSVGEVVDLVGVEVVRDYSECTGCDTEGGVDKSLRNTGRKFG